MTTTLLALCVVLAQWNPYQPPSWQRQQYDRAIEQRHAEQAEQNRRTFEVMQDQRQRMEQQQREVWQPRDYRAEPWR